MKRFNSKLFLVCSILLAVVAFMSFSAAFARDEGNAGHGTISNFLADLFNVMRFPVNFLFKKMTRNPLYFSVGLIINCMLYSLLLERIIYYLTKPKEDKYPG